MSALVPALLVVLAVAVVLPLPVAMLVGAPGSDYVCSCGRLRPPGQTCAGCGR